MSRLMMEKVLDKLGDARSDIDSARMEMYNALEKDEAEYLVSILQYTIEKINDVTARVMDRYEEIMEKEGA